MKVKVSVLMAVYNTEFGLVKRAIDSVLSQGYQNFELIIIDDGSVDDSQKDLLSYVIQNDEKITYVRHKNKGQSESINRGIMLSKGEFITIIDADDEYKPNHLETCLQEMTQNDLIASVTETIVNHDGDFYVPDRFNQNKLIHVDKCILFATLFGKKEVFTSISFEQKYGADAHFYEMASHKYKVNKVNSRTYIYYRNSPTSICSKLKQRDFANAN
ncbi:MAG: glycosyltransferase family 2 protein [Saprospiraceae bacterium]|nr:glycosyltransferase family 2 protein [Saprospiraceae bacterium]